MNSVYLCCDSLNSTVLAFDVVLQHIK